MLVPHQAVNDVTNVDDDNVVAEDATELTPSSPTPPPLQELPSTSQVAPTPPPSLIAPPSSLPQPSQPTTISMELLNTLLETCTTLTRRVKNLEQDKIAQALEITKLKQMVRRLEKRNKVKAFGLRRLKKVRTPQRIESSTDTIMDDQEDASKQGGKIAKLDADKDGILKDVAAELEKDAEVPKDAAVQGSAARRRKGVVIRDPEKTATPSTIVYSEPKSKDKGKGILVEEPKPLKKQAQIEQDEAYARELEAELNKNINWNDVIEQVKRKEKKDNVVLRYQALKRKPQTEAQARKNIMYFNSNVAFLEKSKKQLEEDESRALKRQSKSFEQQAAKKQKLDEEVEELKKHLQIVPNEEDDVYTEATPLALKFPVIVQERFASSKPSNFLDDFLLATLKAMFENPDVEAQVWKNQIGIHDLAKVKSWSLLESLENQANKSAGLKEANNSAGTQANDVQSASLEEIDLQEEHFVLLIWSAYSTTVKSSGDKIEKNIDEKEANDAAEPLRKEATHDIHNANTSSTNLLNIVSTPLSIAGPSRAFNDGEPSYLDDPSMPHLEDIYAIPSEGIFTDSFYDDEGMVTNFNNLETTMNVSPNPTTRIPTIHPKTQILGDPISAVQARSKVNKNSEAHALITLEDESWVDAMQEDLMQFQIQKKSWCDEFEELMKNRFQMSSMGELTFFLGLQVKQKEDGIFISQDKYVAEILKKFDFLSVKTASTPIETQKPLVKDEKAADVDVTLKTSHIQAMKRIFRKSTIGGYQFLGRRLISWQCKKSTIVATSTTKEHFIRDAYEKKLIQVLKIHIDDNVADLLTKAFDVSSIELASPKQMALEQTTTSKEISNSFMAGSLPKTTLPNSIVKNIEAGVPFFMFPRFVQLLIDPQLGDMSHHKEIYANPSHTKKVFANMKRVSAGFSRVVIVLFDTMLVPAAEEVCLIQVNVQSTIIPTKPFTSIPHKKHKSKKQKPKATKVPSPEPSPEHMLPSPSNDPLPAGQDSMQLKELMDFYTCLSNKEKSFKQGRIIEKIDKDVEINLEEAQVKLYKIDLEHPKKVLSMQDVDEEEPGEVEEVLEVVKATKLMTEVQSKDKGKGILIEEPKPLKGKPQIKQDEAFARQLEAELNVDIIWNAVMEQVTRSERMNDAVMKYQALKRKPLTEAQARKNMIIYLKNMVGFKMNYFKGMTYSEIRPLFEKQFNFNQAFLDEVNKEVTLPEKEVELEAHKRESKSHEKEVTKKQRMDEEAEDLKSHLQIVANDDDDMHKEATPLESKIHVVDYKIYFERNKPYFKIIRADGNHMLFLIFSTMLKNFDREDLETL
nr:hypothetical protein [Tanacetum cinerariifolium]